MIRSAIATAAATLAVAGSTIGTASAGTAVSSNWSGYAVSGATFATVSGAWTQPAADCSSASSITASAFWVGLGGNSETSNALEQTGTEADCNADGNATYSAWYELVPAASVQGAAEGLGRRPDQRLRPRERDGGDRPAPQPDHRQDVHEDAADGRARHRVGRMGRRGALGAHSGRLEHPPADRLREDPLHERERHVDERTHRHDRRLCLVGDADPPRSRAPAAARAPSARSPRSPARTEAITSSLASGGSAFTVTWRQTSPAPPQGFYS